MKLTQLFDKNPNLFASGVTPSFVPQRELTGFVKKRHNLSESQHVNRECFDLYKIMKPFIIFGHFILIIPCAKPTNKSLRFLLFSHCSLVGSIFIVIWSLLEIILSVIYLLKDGKRSKIGVMGYVHDSRFFIYSTFRLFIYLYFIKSKDKFYKIFDKWSEMTTSIKLQEDKLLKYLTYALIASTMPSLAVHISIKADLFDRKKGLDTSTSLLEKFLKITNHPIWEESIPYYMPLSLLQNLINIWTEFPPLFVHAFVIFFARALSFQFEKLIENATNSKVSEAHCADMENKGKKFWCELVNNYRELVRLLKTINNFTSPLVFWWITYNIYCLCVKLFLAMSGIAQTLSPHIFLVQFLVDLGLFVITLICAAQVNKNATRILFVLRNCPENDFYDTEVCRLEHQIATGPNIGFSGMGCFVITKPFLIKVFSAIFTLLLVMLQSTPSTTKAKKAA